jgi:hypothetical protein
LLSAFHAFALYWLADTPLIVVYFIIFNIFVDIIFNIFIIDTSARRQLALISQATLAFSLADGFRQIDDSR